MSGQMQHSSAKTSNLPDKCPMTGANLQAWDIIFPDLSRVFLDYSELSPKA